MSDLAPRSLRCLVLGSSGFIGSHLVQGLALAGHQVLAFDRRPFLYPIESHKNVETVAGDFLDAALLERCMHDSDAVFHLVSTTLPKTSNDDPERDVRENLSGTLAMLEAARRAQVKKVIFLSSGGTVYGLPRSLPIDEHHSTEPLSSYGIVKRTIEHYLALFYQLHGLAYQVVRLSNPFGPRQPISGEQGVIAVFMAKALRHEPIEIWGDGSVIRDYIYISDVIAALQQTLVYSGSCRIMNIGSGLGLTLNQVIDGIASITETEINKRYLSNRPFDTPASVLSIARAFDELAWQPVVHFEDGLRRTMDWIKPMLSAK